MLQACPGLHIEDIVKNPYIFKDKKIQDLIIVNGEALKKYVRVTRLDTNIVSKRMYETEFNESVARKTLTRYKMRSLLFKESFNLIRSIPRK